MSRNRARNDRVTSDSTDPNTPPATPNSVLAASGSPLARSASAARTESSAPLLVNLSNAAVSVSSSQYSGSMSTNSVTWSHSGPTVMATIRNTATNRPPNTVSAAAWPRAQPRWTSRRTTGSRPSARTAATKMDSSEPSETMDEPHPGGDDDRQEHRAQPYVDLDPPRGWFNSYAAPISHGARPDARDRDPFIGASSGFRVVDGQAVNDDDAHREDAERPERVGPAHAEQCADRGDAGHEDPDRRPKTPPRTTERPAKIARMPSRSMIQPQVLRLENTYFVSLTKNFESLIAAIP